VKGINVPLLSMGSASLTGVLPFELPVNTTVQLIVSRGNTYSVPVPVNHRRGAACDFTNSDSQARVFHASRPDVLVSATDPARPGEAILIECAGLGTVAPPVDNGVAPTDTTVTVNTVHVRIADMMPGRCFRPESWVPSACIRSWPMWPSPIPADPVAALQISVEERVSEAVAIAVGDRSLVDLFCPRTPFPHSEHRALRNRVPSLLARDEICPRWWASCAIKYA